MKRKKMTIDKQGRFVREHQVWDGTNWDDGCMARDKRFIVYRPDYPCSKFEGYVPRAHVVWWLSTGLVVPTGFVLHHINGDKLDDRIENLQLMTHADHTGLHRSGEYKEPVLFTCQWCGEEFYAINKRSKYCSDKCSWTYFSHKYKPRRKSKR